MYFPTKSKLILNRLVTSDVTADILPIYRPDVAEDNIQFWSAGIGFYREEWKTKHCSSPVSSSRCWIVSISSDIRVVCLVSKYHPRVFYMWYHDIVAFVTKLNCIYNDLNTRELRGSYLSNLNT